jgi:hypothetical protein
LGGGSASTALGDDGSDLCFVGWPLSWFVGAAAAVPAEKGIRSNIQAGVPITPWHTDKTWPEITEPVTIVGGENDTVADEDQQRRALLAAEHELDAVAGTGHPLQALAEPGREVRPVQLRLYRHRRVGLPQYGLLANADR